MSPLQLRNAFIGLKMLKADFKKIEGRLLAPSYTQELESIYNDNQIIIIYELEHNLQSAKEYQWLNDIKVNWNKNIIIPFEYMDEFFINEYTQCNGVKYSLKELSNALRREFIKYPKPYYPSSKKELYRKLVWYAMRVNQKEVMYKEILYAVALRFNSHLEDRYSLRELYKKVVSAFEFVKNNQKIKSKDEVMQIKRENGLKRAKQIGKEYKERVEHIKELIPLHVKPNGKPNITEISKKLNLHRLTVSRIIKILSMIFFIIWIKTSLVMMNLDTREIVRCRDTTIIQSATVTLFSKPLFKGFKRGHFLQNYTL